MDRHDRARAVPPAARAPTGGADRARAQSLLPSRDSVPPAAPPEAPLAARMRPRSLDEVVGQEHAIGPGTVLHRALGSGRLPSLLLWGPPGCGKTTIAHLLAHRAGAHLIAISAVSSGIGELRAAVVASAQRGERTVLFVDELHRWSRAQQDAALPHVESGALPLIGATTENPSFEVNASLLSRMRVVRLRPLADSDLQVILRRAVEDAERGLGALAVDLSPDALSALTALAGGDARVALNVLELAAHAAAPDAGNGRRPLTSEAIAAAAQQPVPSHDRQGDRHYDVISALIKSVRASDPDASLFWLARMLEAGEDPMFVARRLVILAAEDVGLARPEALSVAVAAWQAAHFVGLPEAVLPLAEATIYLATAPKSNAVLTAYADAAEDVRAHPGAEVPLHLRNAPTGLMRAMGYGRGYAYPHDDPSGAAALNYLPDGLRGRRYLAEPWRSGRAQDGGGSTPGGAAPMHAPKAGSGAGTSGPTP